MAGIGAGLEAPQNEHLPFRVARARAKLPPRIADELDKSHHYSWDRDLFGLYQWVENDLNEDARRYLDLTDRYYLLVFTLNRHDMLEHGEKGSRWLYERCREVEEEPYGYLDLWARDSYKSTCITFGGATQTIIIDPEVTIGIFSHTRPTAKAFLLQIKQEMEMNETLRIRHQEVLWWEPKREAPRWSLDLGIVVKRRGNPKEGTIEAWGLVDGQPTSKHFSHRIYDDVWTRDSVTSPEMIKKTQEARELSDNLGTRRGTEQNIGTRYSFGDGYGTMIDREIIKPRIYPATDDGTATGNPVFLTDEEWAKKKRMQPSVLNAQQLQNPLAGSQKMFEAKWLTPYWCRPRTMNVYIVVDPSKGNPNRRSDRCAMAAIGVDAGENKYLLDGFRHRMKLPERWKNLKMLYQKWNSAPGVQMVSVGYEQYGMQTDLEHFEERMRLEGIVFHIEELNWTRDHGESKTDRVERLVPDIKSANFFLPAVCQVGPELCYWNVVEKENRIAYTWLKDEPREWRMMEERGEAYRNVSPIKRVNEERELYDLTDGFMEESLWFPYGSHDDLIDVCSRIYDMQPTPPAVFKPEDLEPEVFTDT